jgi:hypothetical protein
MSISSMRSRGAAALITAGAAAAAVLALAVPAGASTGTAEISPEQAGYTATGAQFKTITAAVYLRRPAQYSGQVDGFSHSVQLWSSGLVVTLGAQASDAGYIAKATVYDRSTHAVIAPGPAGQYCFDGNCGPDPAPWPLGSTLTLRISYSPADGQLTMTEDEGAASFTASYTATGQSFTQARAGTEFGSTPWDGSYSYTPPAQYTKVAAFSNVGLATYSGHASTLWSWWTHHKLLANTGQQSGHDWVAIPTDLTSGGASFQTWFVPQNQQSRNPPVLH